MPTYDVAHITDQGLDVIIVPLHANFQFRTWRNKREPRPTFNKLRVRLDGIARSCRFGIQAAAAWDSLPHHIIMPFSAPLILDS